MNGESDAFLRQALRGKGLDENGVPSLLRYGIETALRAGRQVAWQDEEIDRCFLVLSGRLVPTKRRNGAAPVALPPISRGEWACLAEIVASAPAQADYAALEDAVCLAFSPFNLAAARKTPSVEKWIGLSLARVALALHSHLAEGGPRERIAAWLLSRRRDLGGVASASVSTTQAEIARVLGLSRETVNKRLAEFEATGLLSTGRAEIKILDWKAIERALGEE